MKKIYTLLLLMVFTTALFAQGFVEDFEGATFPPTGWTKIVTTPNDITQSDTQNHTPTGTYSARFSSYSSSSDYNQYLFSSPITIAAGYTQLSFWHRKYNTNASELLEYGISTTTADTASVPTWTAVTLTNTEWVETIVDLSAYVGQTIYLSFHYYGSYAYYVYLDDVVIDMPPACPIPTTLTAANITTTTADLSWTEMGSATLWDIEIGPAGFTPTGNMTYYGITNPFTVTNLSPATTYDWYVHADCGGGLTSQCEGPHTFTTACISYTVFPYTESFDNNTLPACWTIDPIVSGDSWEVASSEIGGHGATGDATGNGGSFLVIDDSTPETVPAHLYSPTFDLTGVTNPLLTFSYWIGDAANTSELHIDIITSTGTDTSIAVVSDSDGATAWDTYTLPLAAYAGQSISIDFRAMESASYNGDISIDDISIFDNATPPSCSNLSMPLDSAIDVLVDPYLSWDASSGASGYYLSLGTDNPPTNVLNSMDVSNNLSYLLASLSSNTTYYWQVNPYNVNGTATGCEIFQFTTVACPAPTALSTNSITPYSANLDWNPSGTTVNFDIEIFASTDTATGTPTHLGVTNPFSASGLTPATTYTWYVRADCGGTYSDWVGPNTFTTACVDITSFPWLEEFTTWPPVCWDLTGGTFDWEAYTTTPCAKANFWGHNDTHNANLTSPTLDVTTLVSPALEFDWSHLYSTSYPLDELDVAVSDDNGLTWTSVWNKIGADLNSADGAGNTAPGTFASSGTIDLSSFGSSLLIRFNGNSGYGPDVFIDNVTVFDNNTAPPCGTLAMPSNLEADMLTDLDLIWNTAMGANGYNLSVGTDNPPTNLYNAMDVGNTLTYSLTGLSYNTTYYWQVAPYNSTGAASGCDVFEFTTMGAPDCAVLTAPADSADPVALEGDLTWDAVYGAQGYYLNFGTDNPPTNIANNVDLGDTVAYYFSGLANGTEYFWQILPYNNGGTAAGCDVQTFTTMALPTGASCDYYVVMTDDYGDGWNGGLLTISVGGIAVATDLTISGAGPDTVFFSIYDGMEITTTYTAGSWGYENEYHIYDSEGNEFFADGVGGVEPGAAGTPGAATCPSCDYTLELYDSYGDGWNGGIIDVLVDGIVVLDDITISGSSGSFTFNVYHGSAITTVYTEGSWSYENSYSIFDPNGVIVFSDGDGGAVPATTGDAGLSNCLAPAPGSMCSAAWDYGFVNDPSITETLSADAEVWYMVTLDDDYANVEFSLCGSTFNTKLELWDDCGATSYIEMNDNYCDTASQIDMPYLTAGTYYLKIYADAGITGDYTLEITGEVAIMGCMAPGALNFVPNANVDDGTCYFFGDSCSLSMDYGFINDPMVINATQYAYDVDWYTFTAYQDYVDVMVSLCGSAFDTKLEVWDDCGSLTYMYYNDDSYGTCGGTQSHIDIPSLPAGTYYVKVYGYSSNYGAYNLEITGDFAAFQGCYYNIELMDSYGDGWNGGYLDIEVNGVTLDANLSLVSGSSATFGIPVLEGDIISMQYNPGQFASENSFSLYDPVGNLVFTDGTVGSPTSNIHTYTATCAAVVNGCTDPMALNYADTATVDDGTCVYVGEDCGTALDYGFINDPMLIGNLNTDREMWYTFTLDEDYINVEVSLCGSSFNTMLEVLDACGGNVLDMNDDYCNEQSQIDFDTLTAGTYYAKVYGDVGLGGAFNLEITGTAISTTNPQLDWSFINTGLNHTILVPQNVSISIEGNPAEIGDYIGVFFVANGVHVCGGYTEYTGITTSVAAWGDDVQTGNKDGFQSGDEFIWKIWQASTGITYDAVATYIPTPGMPNEQYYSSNGMSGLVSLGGAQVDYQQINLPLGWSMMSTYIVPNDSTCETVFGGIVNFISIVKNDMGQVYWPSQFGLNQIGSIEIGQGYQLKTDTACLLELSGIAVDPELTPIALDQTWNIIAYLRNTCASIETMLASIATDIEIVKNGNGDVYWPAYNVNMIGNMMPGEAYQVRVANTTTLVYPANGAAPSKSASLQKLQKFSNNLNTGANMTIGIPSSAWETMPAHGDEVAVFNTTGQLIGASVYTGGNMAITVWGTDEYATISEGCEKASTFVVKVWNQSSNQVSKLNIVWELGNGSYQTNEIAIAAKATIMDAVVNSLEQNIPNPFSGTTRIAFEIAEAGNVTISVFNLLGDKIQDVVSQDFAAGQYTVEFDASALAAGTYLYKIVSNSFIETKNMVVK